MGINTEDSTKPTARKRFDKLVEILTIVMLLFESGAKYFFLVVFRFGNVLTETEHGWNGHITKIDWCLLFIMLIYTIALANCLLSGLYRFRAAASIPCILAFIIMTALVIIGMIETPATALSVLPYSLTGLLISSIALFVRFKELKCAKKRDTRQFWIDFFIDHVCVIITVAVIAIIYLVRGSLLVPIMITIPVIIALSVRHLLVVRSLYIERKAEVAETSNRELD